MRYICVSWPLAEILLESLDYEEDFLVSDEWMNEIQKRCREIDEGEVQLIRAEDALARIFHKFSGNFLLN